MTKSKSEILQLLAGGGYCARQRKDDFNRDDIRLRREDGSASHIENYPYRVNQIPSYMFEEFLREGLIQEDGLDPEGSKIFRATPKAGCDARSKHGRYVSRFPNSAADGSGTGRRMPLGRRVFQTGSRIGGKGGS
jgi:hypothetical protein